MQTIHDYIRFVSDSMLVDLDKNKVNEIASKLVESSKYKEMLEELEEMIREENKAKWRNK
ncbi:hypothetical protein [Pseudogracilibacillus auburnensis]|uniref:hypothetical protein n=1 Tax=Pseudogracilibacillus auburnensis TaxID=1494959 RepID=UPI001A9655FE|nr:hypothetical protein [Pseudogracilibacillus auburnensis]MBO1003161.1 hypothetical protein [Pseudogracilibacillus auburnensis]